ncbi:MAG: hypothetical protein HQ526_08995 [Actinobacteria bacterium]|nr:hypothetical protein [Actinomycetota bacterium]
MTITADGVIVLRKRAETSIRVEVNNVTVVDNDFWAHLLPGRDETHCDHEFVLDNHRVAASWQTKAKRSTYIRLRPVSA